MCHENNNGAEAQYWLASYIKPLKRQKDCQLFCGMKIMHGLGMRGYENISNKYILELYSKLFK